MIPLRICTQLLRDHKIFTNSQINPSPNESISRKDNNSVNLPTTSVSANHLSPQDRAVLCTIANECVRNIMQRHLDVQWMLLREEVNNDWTHLDNGGLHPDSDPTNSDSTARWQLSCVFILILDVVLDLQHSLSASVAICM